MSSTPFRQRLALQVLAKRNSLQAAGAQGFTLIELLVVIVILGVLGAVGYQQYIAQIARAHASIAQNTATAVAKNCAGLAFTGDQGSWTTADFIDDTRVTVTGTCGALGVADQTFTVAVGTNTGNTRSTTATVTSGGAVTPAPTV